MEKENIVLLAQLFTGMKDAAMKLEEAFKNEDIEQVTLMKKEILALQAKIDQVL